MLQQLSELTKKVKVTLIVENDENDNMKIIVLFDPKGENANKMNITPLFHQGPAGNADEAILQAIELFSKQSLSMLDKIKFVTESVKKAEKKATGTTKKSSGRGSSKNKPEQKEEPKDDLFSQPATAETKTETQSSSKAELTEDPGGTPEVNKTEPPAPDAPLEVPDGNKKESAPKLPPSVEDIHASTYVPSFEEKSATQIAKEVAETLPSPPSNIAVVDVDQNGANVEIVPTQSELLKGRIAEVLSLSKHFELKDDGIQLDQASKVLFTSLETMPEGVYTNLLSKWAPTPEETFSEAENGQITLEQMIAEEVEIKDPLRARYDAVIKKCKQINLPLGAITFEGQNEATISKLEEIVESKLKSANV